MASLSYVGGPNDAAVRRGAMTGVSKNVRDRGSDDAGTDVSEASETDVSGERTDISERRIQRDDSSTAHVYLTLLIQPA
jgi:hypothetical protein